MAKRIEAIRLIDANELKEHLFVGADYDKIIDDGISKTDEEVFAFQCGWNDALKSVSQFAPTVDAVEVVRCKDCRYYLNSNEKCGLVDTRLRFYETDKVWTEDSFCSWGERRENETD